MEKELMLMIFMAIATLVVFVIGTAILIYALIIYYRKNLVINVGNITYVTYRGSAFNNRTIIFNNFKIQGDMNTLTIIDIDAQGAVGVINFGTPVSLAGNPTTVEEGSLELAPVDETLATAVLSPEDGPYAVKVTLTGKAGSVDIRLKADADRGEGVKPIEGLFTIVIEAGEATGFGEATATAFVKPQ